MTASQTDCVFCKIANGETGVPFLLETDQSVAFRDQSPAAREHVLIIPRQHIASIDAMQRSDANVLIDLFEAARKVAKHLGIDGSGYRLVTNVGPDAGQTVFHLHLHLVGGEPLGHFGA